MQINFVKQDYSSKIENHYSGLFDSNNFFAGDKTNFLPNLLSNKSETMDNLEILKNVIQEKFNNNIDLFSKAMGIPVQIIYDYLEGRALIPSEISDKAYKLNAGKLVQPIIEIENTGPATINNVTGGDNMVNYFTGSNVEEIKKLQEEIERLTKIVKDKKC